MAFYILITGTIYIGLGLIIGLRATRAPLEPLPNLGGSLEEHPSATIPLTTEIPPEPSFDTAPVESIATPPPIIESLPVAMDEVQETTFSVDKLPKGWAAILENCVACKSFVEAGAQVMRLEVGPYRDALIEVETHARVLSRNFRDLAAEINDPAAPATPELMKLKISLGAALDELRHVSGDWKQRLSEALAVLREREVESGPLADLADRMIHSIDTQLRELCDVDERLSRLNTETRSEEYARKILGEIKTLIDRTHELRELIFHALVTVLTRENRLAEWGAVELIDQGTQLRNRAGLELWLRQWWAADPQRQRQLSAVYLDVDDCAALNAQWGTRIGDQILHALGPLVDGILRKNRGCDLSTRLSGQRYLVLLADTGPRGANSAAERIRQTIEASYFDHPLGKIQLQTSIGVTDVRKNDSVETLLDRLGRCMNSAKSGGRNRTALDEGTGPVCLMAPKLEIRSQSAAVRDLEEEPAEEAVA